MRLPPKAYRQRLRVGFDADDQTFSRGGFRSAVRSSLRVRMTTADLSNETLLR